VSKHTPYVGRVVALTRLPVFSSEHGDLLVSGLWTVEEYQPVEYAAGITTECFTLASVHHTDEDGYPLLVTVDPYALIEQIDPGEHMQQLDFEAANDRDGDRQLEAEVDGVKDERYGQPYEGVLRVHPAGIPGFEGTADALGGPSIRKPPEGRS